MPVRALRMRSLAGRAPLTILPTYASVVKDLARSRIYDLGGMSRHRKSNI